MSRLEPLAVQNLTAEQRVVYERIASGPRGGVRGPLLAWLYSPEFAERAQQLGEYLRYQSRLGPRLFELAILVVARHWNAQYEWFVHAPIAERNGVPKNVIDSISADCIPSFEVENDRLIYEVTTELLDLRRLSEETYRAAVERLGEAVLVELSGIIGYYTLGAFTLNMFDISPPEGSNPILPERREIG